MKKTITTFQLRPFKPKDKEMEWVYFPDVFSSVSVGGKAFFNLLNSC